MKMPSETPEMSRPAASRLDALEMRVSHQDQMITDLNDVITQQWKTIDRLTRQIDMLRETMQSMAPQREGPEPPPPHY